MMKLKYLVIFLLSTFGFASPQIPELLIYKNDTIPIYNLMIEEYLDMNKQDIFGSSEGKLFGLNFRGGSFNCWRGYQGIYKIENDSLFVVDMVPIGGFIEINEDGERVSSPKPKSYLEVVFSDRIKNNKVFVDWFSGNIAIRNGDLLRWDGVFVRKFEKEKVISIEKGIFKNIIEVQNYIDLPNGINRRYNDKITDEIFKELEKPKWRNWDDCAETYEILIGKNGQIKKVRMAYYKTQQEIKEYWTRKEYNYCIKKVNKAVQNLQFDIVKDHGDAAEETVYLEFWVGEDGIIENRTY